MNKHSIVNLKCPSFLFRYPKLDLPSKALFNLHRASALPLGCGSEYDQNFQSPPGHSRLSVTRRWYTMVLVWQGDPHQSRDALSPVCRIFCLIFCQAGVNSHHQKGGGAETSDCAHLFLRGLHREWKRFWNTQMEYYRMKGLNVGILRLFRYIFDFFKILKKKK